MTPGRENGGAQEIADCSTDNTNSVRFDGGPGGPVLEHRENREQSEPHKSISSMCLLATHQILSKLLLHLSHSE